MKCAKLGEKGPKPKRCRKKIFGDTEKKREVSITSGG